MHTHGSEPFYDLHTGHHVAGDSKGVKLLGREAKITWMTNGSEKTISIDASLAAKVVMLSMYSLIPPPVYFLVHNSFSKSEMHKKLVR